MWGNIQSTVIFSTVQVELIPCIIKEWGTLTLGDAKCGLMIILLVVKYIL